MTTPEPEPNSEHTPPNTPPLRFAGFTAPWEKRTVAEMATEKLSNGVMNYQVNDETGLKHINVVNMYDSDKIHPENLTFSGYDEDVVEKCNVELGDIFLTRSSLKPEGIAEANVLLDSGRFVYDDHLIRLKVDKEKYDPLFVKINLCGGVFKKQFIVKAKTTAFTTIGQDDIAECSGLFPSLPEQQKIGRLFSVLDTLIGLQKQKCEKLVCIKRALLSKMFVKPHKHTPEVRFAGFSDPWEVRTVQDVADRFDNLRIPVTANLRVHGTTPYYGANGIQDYVDGFTHDGEFVLVAEDGANDLKNYPVKCVNGRIWVNNHAHVLQGKAGIADNNFLAFAISQSDIEALLVGGGRAKLNAEILMSIELKLPSLPEQQKIGQFFSTLDRLISLQKQKLATLGNLKQALLGKMFV